MKLKKYWLFSHSFAVHKARNHNSLVMIANAGCSQINRNRQHSWGNSHRSRRTCQSPWSWSGRWVVWCTRSRHSSSPPLTGAHRKHRPTETGSLPCLAPVEDMGLRILPQITNRNISSTFISATYWLVALKTQNAIFYTLRSWVTTCALCCKPVLYLYFLCPGIDPFPQQPPARQAVAIVTEVGLILATHIDGYDCPGAHVPCNVRC